MVILSKRQIDTLRNGGQAAKDLAQEVAGMMETKGMSGHDLFIDVHKQTSINASEWLALLQGSDFQEVERLCD